MRIRLRQVALVARDLDVVESAIEERLGLELCFRDPGVATFGLRNALYPVGDKLLEIVSPTEEGTTAGRLLDKRGGDGGYMVIFEIDDLEEMSQRLTEVGARVVFEARVAGVVGLHIHPRDVGGAIVSVDRTDEWGEWPWAGPSWRVHVRTDVVHDIVGVEVGADDPSRMAARWADVLGRPAEGLRIQLDEGEVRFVPAGPRGDGVDAIVLAGSSPASFELAGCRIDVLEAS